MGGEHRDRSSARAFAAPGPPSRRRHDRGTPSASLAGVVPVMETFGREGNVGIFDKKEKPKADFSNVQSGSSTNAPEVPAPPAGQAAGRTYTVKSGDSLSAIARQEYGDASAWRRIYEANRDQISDPDMIHPGQELKIPAAEGGAS